MKGEKIMYKIYKTKCICTKIWF